MSEWQPDIPPEDPYADPDAPSVGIGGFEPVDLTAYAEGTYVQEEATILLRADGVGLLYPGKVHAFNGEPESGKSMLAQWAVAGDLKDGRDCLVLDYESDPQSYVGRLREMGVPIDAIVERLVYINPEGDPVNDHAARAALYDVTNSRDFTIAVFDGMTEALALSGLATNSNDDVTVWHRLVARCPARRGAAVVVVDHVTKSSENRGRYGIGAQAKLAAITGAAYLVEVRKPLGRGLIGEISLKVAKDRVGYINGHAGTEHTAGRLQEAARVTVDGANPGTITVDIEAPQSGASNDWRPTHLMESITEALALATEPLSFRGIKEQVRGKEEHIRTAIAALIEDRIITTSRGPRNATLHAIATAGDTEPSLSDSLSVSTVSLLRDGVEGDSDQRIPETVGRRSGDTGTTSNCTACGEPFNRPGSLTRCRDDHKEAAA